MFSALSIRFFRLAYVEKTNTIISWAKPLVWESYRLASGSSYGAWFRLAYSSYLLNNVIKLDPDNNPVKLLFISLVQPISLSMLENYINYIIKLYLII